MSGSRIDVNRGGGDVGQLFSGGDDIFETSPPLSQPRDDGRGRVITRFDAVDAPRRPLAVVVADGQGRALITRSFIRIRLREALDSLVRTIEVYTVRYWLLSRYTMQMWWWRGLIQSVE